MPELPEVQTTVNGLTKTVIGLTIKDVWSDLPRKNINRPDYRETIKYLPFFVDFQKKVQEKKILGAERRAKNILINLSGGHTILIHMKMTGHIMYGKYAYAAEENLWSPAKDENNEALRDPFNKFLHVVFSFTNGKHLVLSDMRKFAKVTLVSTKEAHTSKHLDGLGPEPLAKDFTWTHFKERIHKKPSGKIKSVLMDQTVVAGVGNIYSDEALWLSGINPVSIVSKIPEAKLKELFKAVITVLKKGIDFGGDSTSDYRQIDGKPGKFSGQHNAYRLTGKACKKKGCPGVILRKVVGGRSAHYCSKHQHLL
ncbi:MAG: bifunctional DNA-formamidopyrimidine glycosylase/DNA-(apurinic or apyrimidinic site) lyase [Candidatus Pacebacteria bacterium]|nr:bifunctional DNA-formamidopyrimidine glycosylase/DNA-(apurinic or apyrimidinic site) lyase [Candidatus Paceibacterota bacterium]